jgi:hypothetical protein
MAKTVSHKFTVENVPFMSFYHFGPTNDRSPLNVHLVYFYDGSNMFPYYFATQGNLQPTFLEAELYARTMIARPAMLADLCPWCHGSPFPGLGCPTHSRWGLRDIKSHEPYPSAILFDWYYGYPDYPPTPAPSS